MGLTNWIMKRGSYGLSISLLILYKHAITAGVTDERERWNFAFQNNVLLPISLTKEDLAALNEVITNDLPWDTKNEDQKPANIVRRIVLVKAMNSVGGRLHPDYRNTIFSGIQKGIDEFKAKNQNVPIE